MVENGRMEGVLVCYEIREFRRNEALLWNNNNSKKEKKNSPNTQK